ncbi:MAG: hypothetical protein GWO24_18285 [Akkermansiaceae bacterium]|nr:hypothetical protein [Akkermansiaceae bacterium]
MKFFLTDYSRDFYGDREPRERRGKFIQVRSGDSEHLVFAPREMCTFHANIAERFFDALGFSGRYNRKRDHFTPRAAGWEIVGGGHWSAEDIKKELELSGTSMAYGRFDPEGLLERLSRIKALSGYTIHIK